MDYFNDGMALLSKGVVAGGSILAIWGMVTFGGALKDHNGPGIQTGIFQMVGGAIIVSAGLLLKNVTM